MGPDGTLRSSCIYESLDGAHVGEGKGQDCICEDCYRRGTLATELRSPPAPLAHTVPPLPVDEAHLQHVREQVCKKDEPPFKPLPAGMRMEPDVRDPAHQPKRMTQAAQEKIVADSFTAGWHACEQEREAMTARSAAGQDARGAPPPADVEADPVVVGGHALDAFPEMPKPKAVPVTTAEAMERRKKIQLMSFRAAPMMEALETHGAIKRDDAEQIWYGIEQLGVPPADEPLAPTTPQRLLVLWGA